MHLVEFFIESHWEIERPILKFYLNQVQLTNGHCVLYEKTNNTSEKLIYKFIVPSFQKENKIVINLSGKTDAVVTKDCDHWIEVKNISIDGVYADWLIYTNTKFVHTMPKQWVNEMKNQHIDILDEYCPGTEMRLNGNTTFVFENPFWLYKTKNIEEG